MSKRRVLPQKLVLFEYPGTVRAGEFGLQWVMSSEVMLKILSSFTLEFTEVTTQRCRLRFKDRAPQTRQDSMTSLEVAHHGERSAEPNITDWTNASSGRRL